MKKETKGREKASLEKDKGREEREGERGKQIEGYPDMINRPRYFISDSDRIIKCNSILIDFSLNLQVKKIYTKLIKRSFIFTRAAEK